MITDDGLGSAPLRQRVPKDLKDPRKILPLAAARTHDGPTIAIKDQNAIEPLALDLHQIPEIDKPDLMGCCRRLRAFGRIGAAFLRLWVRMGLFIERHHLPDRGMAIAIAQGIQGHLHPIVAQEGIVVQQLEDVHHRLDRHPHGDRRVGPRLRRQPD
jgi:hypothetical protein